MPSGFKKNGRSGRLAPDLSAPVLPETGLPGLTPPSPDASLSAAFRHALGGKPGQPHLAGSAHKLGQEIAKRAKAEKPAAPKGPPRKAHIGPRSGHK